MCVVNNTYGFIFVHIPKCAGTSTTHTLSRLTTYADLELGSTEYGEKLHAIMGPRFGISKHSFASEIRGVVGQQIWRRYLTFSFVRNPFERTLSTYSYLKQHQKTYKFMAEYESFDDFVVSEDWSRPGPDRMLQPQFLWLRRRLKSDEVAVDHIGKVETYAEDLNAVIDLIGVNEADRRAMQAEKKNVSKKEKSAGASLSAKGLERIRERYADDFRVFDYPLDPPERWSA